jgi:dTDP-4-amino-4,6-dideoxygalactose transaminase
MIVFGSPYIGEEEIQEVVACLRSGWIGTGPRVRRFEELFREYTGAKNAVAVNSCTAALHLAMVVSGVGPGDEVITTPMTFCATANAILHTGATPVFVDVDPATMNLDPARIEAAITPRTKAILPVHLAGRPCDMDAISAIAARHGLLVIEDAAHCIEGRYRGRNVGTISPLTCFSFYVTKNVVTGEGGMVTTEDDDLAAKIKMNALHGLSADAWQRFSDKGYKHYQVLFPGFKYNMMDLQAALGIHQLERVEAQLVRREAIWQRYDEAFLKLPITRPSPPAPETRHARHLYSILIDKQRCGFTRDEVLVELHRRGIGTGVHYTALHLHPYYRESFGFREGDFPNAERIGASTLSLPLSAKLTEDEVGQVIRAVRACFS